MVLRLKAGYIGYDSHGTKINHLRNSGYSAYHLSSLYAIRAEPEGNQRALPNTKFLSEELHIQSDGID